MNIFKSFDCPERCAIVLDDKRVIKMILESSQILSTVVHKINAELDAPYKSTHMNHPCTLWAGFSQGNFIWLNNHMKYLCSEYTRRYSKYHVCSYHYDIYADLSYKLNFNSFDLTEHPNCTIYKEIPNVNIAYKMALLTKWENDKRIPKWNRQPKSIEERISMLEMER